MHVGTPRPQEPTAGRRMACSRWYSWMSNATSSCSLEPAGVMRGGCSWPPGLMMTGYTGLIRPVAVGTGAPTSPFGEGGGGWDLQGEAWAGLVGAGGGSAGSAGSGSAGAAAGGLAGSGGLAACTSCHTSSSRCCTPARSRSLCRPNRSASSTRQTFPGVRFCFVHVGK